MKRSERMACARDLVFWEGQLAHVDDSNGLVSQRIETNRGKLAGGLIRKRLGSRAIASAREEAAAFELVNEGIEHPVIAERRQQAAIMAAAELVPVGTIGPPPQLAEVTELPTQEMSTIEPLAA